MGDALSYAGRVEEAISRFEGAIRLSAQDPWSWAFLSYGAFARIFLGQYERLQNRHRPHYAFPIASIGRTHILPLR